MTATSDVSPQRKPSLAGAARILAERDPVIARLLAETGPPRLRRLSGSHFSSLVQAIVYQQLAGRAAAAIHGRLIAALGGEVEPQGLIALSDETLRAVGLSRAKVMSLRDLAVRMAKRVVDEGLEDCSAMLDLLRDGCSWDEVGERLGRTADAARMKFHRKTTDMIRGKRSR